MTTETPTFPELRQRAHVLRDQHEEAQKIYLETLADEAEALPRMHHYRDQYSWVDISASCAHVRNGWRVDILLFDDGSVTLTHESAAPVALDATLLDVMRRELTKAQARAESGAS